MRARKLLGLVAVARGDGLDDGLVLALARCRAARYRKRRRTEQGDPVLQFARGVVEIAVARGTANRLMEGAVEPGHLGGIGHGSLSKGLLDISECVDLGR